jgi:hypothetical protein
MPTGDAPVDGDLEAPPCRYRGSVGVRVFT